MKSFKSKIKFTVGVYNLSYTFTEFMRTDDIINNWPEIPTIMENVSIYSKFSKATNKSYIGRSEIRFHLN